LYGKSFYVTARGRGREKFTHYLEEQLVTLKEKLEEKILRKEHFDLEN
jgi:1-acyl-sn-glycerol-3-phosphate acyltransferase (EC 2.3.1.51)